MPEYPTYPGSDPEQPSDGSNPPQPPPPPGAWPPPEQPTYQQPPHGYAQQGYPQQGAYPPPGYPQPGYSYAAPKHPNATTSMVLGIVSVAAGMMCYLPFFLAPFAWFMGAKAVREIDASGGHQGGRSEAMAGKVLGIIGTVLLTLALLFAAFLITMAFVEPSFYED